MNVTGIRVGKITVNEYLLSAAMLRAGLDPLRTFTAVYDDLRQAGQSAAEEAARRVVLARLREMVGWSKVEWETWQAEQARPPLTAS